MTRVVAAAIALGFGCGDDVPPPCLVEHYAGPYGELLNFLPDNCIAARRFVARDSPTLTPSQEDVDRYYERWVRAVAAEPVLFNRQPQRHRQSSELVTTIFTTNTAVIDAIDTAVTSAAVPPTDDATFDQIISELVRPRLLVKHFEGGPGEVPYFMMTMAAPFNEELLHTRLLPTGSRLNDRYVAHSDDGVWTWPELGPGTGADDATAQIDFRFGWGDCFVSCVGMHAVRAIVPPEGPAIVFDMGGDPLPPGMALSPNTLPPP